MQIAPKLENLEIPGCICITEYGIESIIKYPHLQFLDIGSIPVVTPAFLENLKNLKPKLLLRKFKYADADPKDNGLRVPLRVVDKKAGKGKKKGKKKK